MAKKNEEETDYIDYGEVKIDPETADVAFVDPSIGEDGVQVVISANPDNPAGCSVAVLTASHGEDVEEEDLLGFGVIDPDEPPAGGEGGAGGEGAGAGAGGEGGSGDGDEAKKTAEARKAEARKNFNERWAAKRAERAEAKKKEEAKKTEERRQACEAAKQKFRAKGKKA